MINWQSIQNSVPASIANRLTNHTMETTAQRKPDSVESASSVTRIAMWSGPRNISTAMMRSWGNRADTIVCDEPFYAYYLRQTELPHPGAGEVLEHHESNSQRIIEQLLGELPAGKTVFYQKQMAHHLLPELDREWLKGVTNCFLIREPREMLASLSHFIPQPTLEDTGLPQQVEIFSGIVEASRTVPIVVDSRDVLQNPRAMLTSLCNALKLPFREEMLSWPPGKRETDGIWGKYWYGSVEETTGFSPYRHRDVELSDTLSSLCRHCETLYEQLFAHRLRP